MEGKVIEISKFKASDGWLFVVHGSQNEKYFIMDITFYRQYKLKTPVTKNVLDNLLVGMTMQFDFTTIDTLNVIIRIHGWEPSKTNLKKK